jgi:hypothetical protein
MVGGLSFLDNKRVGFYTKFVYGLRAMLYYPRIDAAGNFDGNIFDLKNMTLMIGMSVKVFNKSLP